MKKLLLLLPFIAFSYLAQAQSTDFHAFKVDIGFGYAIPSNGNGVKAGATFDLEPHYRISDEFAVGLRIEGAVLGYQDNEADNTYSFSALTSYALTGEYYFMNDGFRPFIGAGVGFFQPKYEIGDDDSGDNVVLNGSTKFGFFPRAGFEAGHFRLSATYNVLGNNSSYAAFTIGFFFGGGKK
jgi:opacity protein-like surface antigen